MTTRRTHLHFSLVALLALLSFHPRVEAADSDRALEYKVKAGFLFNFAKFTEWPASSFSSSTSPLIIGFYAGDPAEPMLTSVLRAKTINSHPVLLKPLSRDDDPRDCHLVFLSRAEQDRCATVIEAVKNAPVLTVSETERFAHRGGIINFVRQDETVRLEINLEAAERVGLKISSKLSSLAKLVKEEKD